MEIGDARAIPKVYDTYGEEEPRARRNHHHHGDFVHAEDRAASHRLGCGRAGIAQCVA